MPDDFLPPRPILDPNELRTRPTSGSHRVDTLRPALQNAEQKLSFAKATVDELRRQLRKEEFCGF
jgi:hypothetical protein